MQDLGPEEYRALARFRYQVRSFLKFSEDAARRFGLEASQHQLLLAAKAMGTPTVGLLARQLQLRHHSVVGLVDRLEQRGLVARSRVEPDRRQVHVALTAEGEEVLRQLSLDHWEELRIAGPRLVEALRAVLEGKA